MLGLAGFLAGFAVVIEPQVAPIAAILGIYLMTQVIVRRINILSVASFALGAIGPIAAWLVYNNAAFGGPFEMGYFHHANPRFARSFGGPSPRLAAPNWSLTKELLWGSRRGLLLFAPIVAFAPIGWIVLLFKKRWAAACVSCGACAAMILVNLSYPEWTGGWSTGPRLLTPILPFAMIAVAGFLAAGPRLFTVAVGLTAAYGAYLMLLCQGVGGESRKTSPTLSSKSSCRSGAARRCRRDRSGREGASIEI